MKLKHCIPNILLLVLVTTGCKTVVRENIISSVETGIGFTLTENPKTELYEAKLGYIRSQFYSVPTGKIVEHEKGHQCHQCPSTDGKADCTPEIVSGIRMESDFRHLLLGASVAENFAVGSTAVMSPAAVAMYVSQAKNDQTAVAAATAVTGYADLTDVPFLKKQQTLDGLLKKALQAGVTFNGQQYTPQQTRRYADDWAAANKHKTVSTIRRMGGQHLDDLIQELTAKVVNN